MTELALFLLGVPGAEESGEIVEIKSRKGLAMLAYLATGGSGQREALAALLWPEYGETEARRNLRRMLYAMNRTPFGEWLQADAEAITLTPGASDGIDICQYTRLMASGTLEDARRAVALYRGDFLSAFSVPDSAPFAEWATLRREHYRRQAVDALARLSAHALERGDFAAAEETARRQLKLDNLRESAWRQLMEALEGSNRPAQALAAYEELEQLLRQELDLAPAPKTVALAEEIRKSRHIASAAAAKRKERVRHNIPAATTTLVGREEELEKLYGWLRSSDVRLITLAGPGGIGKTRLALAVARKMRGYFGDGVFFVPLLPIDSPTAVVPAIANALALTFHEGHSPRQQLLNYLQPQEAMLLLDNVEHLLGADSGEETLGLVEEMLSVAPGLKILTTSRERLRLPYEQVYAVEGLPVGEEKTTAVGERDAAVALFVQQAQRVQPDFAPGDEVEIAHIRELCRLVEGMPLAIELAAAQVPLLLPEEITAQIESGLDVLAADVRGSAVRHRSVRIALETSWHTLKPAEQCVFARLSVFRGGFTLSAAEQVALASASHLNTLHSKSLVRSNAEGRLDLHPLLQTFGAEKLATMPEEGEQTADRHLRHYSALLSEVVAKWKASKDTACLDAVDPETDNLRAGWQWILQGQQWDEVATYVDDLWHFLKLRHRLPEAVEILEQALESGGTADSAADVVHLGHWTRLLGQAHLWLSKIGIGDNHLRKAVSLLGWPVPTDTRRLLSSLLAQLTLQTLHRLWPSRFVGRQRQQREARREAAIAYQSLAQRAVVEQESLLAAYCTLRSLNLAEAARSGHEIAAASVYTGYMFGLIPLRRLAETYLSKAGALAESEDDATVREPVSRMYGIYLAGVGRWDEAEDHLRQAATAAGELGERWLHETNLVVRLFVAYSCGNLERALELARAIGTSARQREDAGFVAAALYWEAMIKVEQGKAQQALRLLQESASAPAEVMNHFDWIIVYATMARAHLQLGAMQAAVQAVENAGRLLAELSRPGHCVSFFGYAGVAMVRLALWEAQADGDDHPARQTAALRACEQLRAFGRIFPAGKPRAWLAQGQYAWLEGKRRKAHKAWQKGLAQAKALQMPLEQGRLHYEIGRHLGPGEKTQQGRDAGQCLQQALRLFTRFGASYYGARARSELDTLDSM